MPPEAVRAALLGERVRPEAVRAALPGPRGRFPGEPAAVPGYTGVMRYTIADLVERSGLSARTIRDYIHLGILDRPKGVGRAATYGEDQLLGAAMIPRLRAEGTEWDAIIDRLRHLSLGEKRAWLEAAEARERAAAAGRQGPAAVSPAGGEADEVPAGIAPPAAEDAEGLPAGKSYVVTSLVPGLALVVRHDASPLARRMAREIVARYASER